MNEALLRTVHRAIRGDRTALRTLVERYQGLTYALAYRHTQSFPQAQSLALRSWPRVGLRLPGLTEPERFPDLLAWAVEDAFKRTPPAPGTVAVDDEGGGGHSILRTEKVQARRALRRALAACPRPEAGVFFLRYVEGLTLEQTAELYGVEPPTVLESLKLTCVDLAYRAGFVGPASDPPRFEQLTPEHREALGFAVHQAEGGLAGEAADRIARYIQEHPEVRREDEGVRTVLGLAAGTFAAHRLPPEFGRDVLMAIPYTEPRVEPAHAATVSAPVLRAEVPQGPLLLVGLGGVLAGMLGTLWLAKVLESIFGSPGLYWASNWAQYEATHAAVLILVLGLGMLSLILACPPFWRKEGRLPPSYCVAYGLLCGAPAALVVYSSCAKYALAGMLAWDILAPFWAVAALGLLAVRVGLVLAELEKRVDLRLRRIEEALSSNPLQPAPNAARTPPAPPPA